MQHVIIFARVWVACLNSKKTNMVGVEFAAIKNQAVFYFLASTGSNQNMKYLATTKIIGRCGVYGAASRRRMRGGGWNHLFIYGK